MYTSKAENIPCNIYIDRMKQYISLVDACNYIGLPYDKLRNINQIDASNTFKEEKDRDILYHLQKIKHFIDVGIDKPIDIDCFCRDGRIYNWPVIVDGRHRYIAALLRKDKFIKATYSGTKGLMDYLQFVNNNRPHYTGNIL